MHSRVWLSWLFFLVAKDLYAGTWVGVLLFREIKNDHIHLMMLPGKKVSASKSLPKYGEVMNIWADFPEDSSGTTYLQPALSELKEAHRYVFFYTTKSTKEIRDSWSIIYRKFRASRSLLKHNCAAATSITMERVFNLKLHPTKRCSRSIFCLWIPSDWTDIPLPEARYQDIEDALIDGNPHVLTHEKALTPQGFLQKLSKVHGEYGPNL